MSSIEVETKGKSLWAGTVRGDFMEEINLEFS